MINFSCQRFKIIKQTMVSHKQGAKIHFCELTFFTQRHERTRVTVISFADNFMLNEHSLNWFTHNLNSSARFKTALFGRVLTHIFYISHRFSTLWSDVNKQRGYPLDFSRHSWRHYARSFSQSENRSWSMLVSSLRWQKSRKKHKFRKIIILLIYDSSASKHT